MHSKDCLPVAKEAFPDTDTRLMYFGINKDLFSAERRLRDEPLIGKKIKVFSAGNDKTRDWDTLLSAVGNDMRFEVTILCRWLDPGLTSKYLNLTIVSDRKVDTILSCYINTDFVVISMFPNNFSGVTVALEAVAMAKPIVCTFTGGVPTYFSADEVFYVDHNNPDMLRDAILQSSFGDRSQKVISSRKKFENLRLDTQGLVARYAELTVELLGS